MNGSNTLRLMIIGGSWEQKPLIQKAKDMGLYVLVTDPDKNAQGFELADETLVLDPRDLPKALKIAKAFMPDGITADECDYSHYAVVYISSCLGLPNDGLNEAQVTTNKLWMRNKCRDSQIIQPRFFGCHRLEDALTAADVIGWPVIVKPVDNRGAFGVNIAHNNEMLKLAFLEALMNAHSRQVIVEAYIEGTHITVDGAVTQEGEHINLGIASKKITKGNKPIIVGVVYPAEVSPEIREIVFNSNSKVIEALGIHAGLTHSEYIVDNKGRCFLIETANRGGGVLTSAKIIPTISRVDLSKLLISNALGLSFEINSVDTSDIVMLTFFIFKSGKVNSIKNLEVARSLPGVIDLTLLIGGGQELSPPSSGAGRHGFAILKAESMERVHELRERILDKLIIEYDV